MFILGLNLTVYGQLGKEEEYWQRHKVWALAQMERLGIPASVSLASAYVEGGLAMGPLKESNNHFALICGPNWTGPSFPLQGVDGQIICYRAYETAEASYRDWADWLVSILVTERLGSSHQAWTKALEKQIYRNKPQYAKTLNEVIAKYDLIRFDTLVGFLPLADEPETETPQKTLVKRRSFLFAAYEEGSFERNRSQYVLAKAGESPLGAASRLGLSYRRFLRFNDLQDGDVLMDFQPLYLGPKSSVYRGEQEFHLVEQDHSMYEIAQLYGLRLEALLRLNRMESGQEPANGEQIALKKPLAQAPKLRPEGHLDLQPLEVPVLETPSLAPPQVETPETSRPLPPPTPSQSLALPSDSVVFTGRGTKPEQALKIPENRRDLLQDANQESEEQIQETDNATPIPPAPTPTPTRPQHRRYVVAPGDSLYKIARQHQCSVEDLRRLNQLKDDQIKPEQILLLP